MHTSAPLLTYPTFVSIR